MRKVRARGGTSAAGAAGAAAGLASAIGGSGFREGCVLEMEVGLPTDNREKKGRGIGIRGIGIGSGAEKIWRGGAGFVL